MRLSDADDTHEPRHGNAEPGADFSEIPLPGEVIWSG